MGVATLSAGTLVAFHGAQYKLTRKFSDSEWELQEDRSQRVTYMEEKQLLRLYATRSLTFPQISGLAKSCPVFADQETEVSEKIKVRRRYVLASLGVNSRSALFNAIMKVWEEVRKPAQAPSIVSVYRWKKNYIMAGKDARGLRDETSKRGNRKPRFPQETLDFCQQSITSRFMSRESRSVQDTYEKALLMTERENRQRDDGDELKLPTRRLIDSLISQIPAFDKVAAREGNQAAVRRFRHVSGSYVTEAPLDCVEIDHTPLDMFVVDDVNSIPLGRPYVTACIDRHTRCILGIHISFAPRDYYSVAQCLKHAFLPKVTLREEYPAIKHDWAAHGVMRMLLMDNGLEFHSTSLRNACFSHGIVMRFSPRKTPWFKGAIERWFREFNRNVAHPNPGTTFSNIIAKGDYDPSKDAVVTYSTLKELVATWVTDVYHRKEHSALGMSPSQKWDSSIRQEDIELACDLDDLDMIMSRTESRTLSRKGIQVAELFYNSIELGEFRTRQGEDFKVDVRINNGDLGHVYVVHPKAAQVFKVPAVREDYATGVSLWLHQQLQGYQEKHPDLSSGPDGWLEAKDRLQQLVADDFKLKKRRTRKAQARFNHDIAAASMKQLQRLNLAAGPVEHNRLRPLATDEIPTDEVHHSMSVVNRAPQPAIAPVRKFTPVIQESYDD